MEIPAKGTCLKGNKLAGYSKSKRDVSSVSIQELRHLLCKAGCTDKEALAQASGIYVRSIHRIFRPGEQKKMGVTLADRLLMAVAHMGYGEFRLGVDLDVFPSDTVQDALVMAVQEHLDDDDNLTADKEVIEARIQELMALRAEKVGG